MRRLLILILMMMLVPFTSRAQTEDTCPNLLSMIEQSQLNCSDAAIDTVCHMASEIITNDNSIDESETITALETVQTITTTASDETLSLATIKRDNWTAILFGDANLTFVGTTRIGVSVAAPNIINVRSAPSSSASLATTLEPNTQLIADGRNTAGDWLRVQLPDDEGIGWIAGFLLNIDGDSTMLPALEGEELTYNTWEAWQFRTAFADEDESCPDTMHGILLQSHDNQIVNIQLNGAKLTFNGTVFLEAPVSERRIRVSVLEGIAKLDNADESKTAIAGLFLPINLNRDGEAAGVPIALRSLELASGLPLNLLDRQIDMPDAIPREEAIQRVSETLACLAVSENSSNARSGPGPVYLTINFLEAGTQYLVTGFAEDDSGIRWWQLEDELWVREDIVEISGQCDFVSVITRIPEPPSREPTGINYGGIQMGNDYCELVGSGTFVEGDRILFQVGPPGYETFEQGVAARDSSTPSIVLDGISLQPLNIGGVDKISFGPGLYYFTADYMWVSVAGEHVVVGSWSGLSSATCPFTVSPKQP